ncbi:MAG TPA: DUF4337 domain-containing protein [Gemmataceae bacterium]|nr:DUF4337 domain-containing protein [Gemmataceae bacterium]
MSQGTEQHLEHAEHARHAAHDPFDRRVAMTMAIIAAVLAAVTMLSHRAHTETLRLQTVANDRHTQSNVYHTQASDQWGYYQAKKNRQYMYQAYADELPILAKDTRSPEATSKAAALGAKWQDTAKKYGADSDGIQKKATELEDEAKKVADEAKEAEHESHVVHQRADRFDLGELGVELALVLCSIAVLTKNPQLWFAAIVVGIIGLGLALSGYVVQ